MTVTDFLDALEIDVPETRSMMDEHLKDRDAFLLDRLTADLGHYAIQSFEAGQSDVLSRLLAVVDRALREGTDDVQKALAVSFVADTRWSGSTMQAFIEARPTGCEARSIDSGFNPDARQW